jgi:hypothetical protein
MAQVVKHLFSKYKNLNSNPSTTKNKNQEIIENKYLHPLVLRKI